MRLKLTVEYDGTGVPRLGAPAGARTVEGELRHALAQLYGRVDALAVAGRTDTGVHALGNVASVEVETRPAAGARRRGAERRCCRTTSACSRRSRRRTRSTRASTRGPLATAIGSGGAACRRRSRRAARSGIRGRSTWTALAANAAALVGHARLHGVHAERDASQALQAHRPRGAVGRAGRDVVAFEITADSFLRHMVRTLVGSMLEGIELRRCSSAGRAARAARRRRRTGST